MLAEDVARPLAAGESGAASSGGGARARSPRARGSTESADAALESATFSVGYFANRSENTSSVAQPKSVIGVPAIMISTGAFTSCMLRRVPEPMWMQTIVPLVGARLQNGSQCAS